MTFRFNGKTYKAVEGGRLWWAIHLAPAVALTVIAIAALYLMAGAGQTF